MRRILFCFALVTLALALAVNLDGQAGAPSTLTPLQASERQFVMGRIGLEVGGAGQTGQTRIQFWLNTPTYLAKPVALEASRFTISRTPSGGQLIESDAPVRVTGFTLERSILDRPMLQNSTDSVLTWDRGFRLEISADGSPAWFCCPRNN
jgi:hypothetical protein